MGSIRDVIAAVQALVQIAAPAAKVENRPGGVVTWAERPGPFKSFWEVDVASIEEGDAIVQGRYEERLTVVVEGWMPMDYKSNTAAVWRDLVDDVRSQLRGNRTLGGPAVFGTGNPQVPEFDLQLVTTAGRSDAAAETVCHHARLEWAVRRRT